MSAFNAALNTIDAAAAEGDLAAHRLMAEQLELEAAGEPRRTAQLHVRLRPRRCWLPPKRVARGVGTTATAARPVRASEQPRSGSASSCQTGARAPRRVPSRRVSRRVCPGLARRRCVARYNSSMLSGRPTSLPPGARAALLAPSAVTRAVAVADRDPERRWMLRLPRSVRRSFVAEVLDMGGGRLHQERWMLLQDDDVRASYVEHVLTPLAEPDAQVMWLLRQERAIRESYVAEVIHGGDPTRGAR